MNDITEIELRLQDILEILKRKWKLVIAVASITTIITALVNFFLITPIFQVNSKVFIGKEENINSKYDNSDVQMYQKLLKTYSELMKTKDLIEDSINKNNLNISADEVIDNLKVTPMTDTQILQVSYENKDKVLAREVLVSIIDEFMLESKTIIQNGNVKVIESAELPEKPISPQKALNVAIAFIIGFMVGASLALIKEYVDDTVKTKEQTENVMGLPVIGMIPCEENN
ncbi:capsular polysaccharide biosynthesis protein [Clostridium saccharoperbutylacetonicum]|uniref:Capsular polysaccharide biosynthesis protein n=1 Tax=Clostridium saccharoperbutylacetonicum N1-4(HMT) TaxID=931276 RepID=M1MNQ3_9CLOT|nr:Wzz/FepE/Etk N-terminal domain-containing protein [Clostridium saccharoperbutylacetonicum]AGF56351.1 capsular polysaccharide biosynthesis protein [Clostridium saccharoperbutylacetonicum N1-4(HMT)]NRT62905.1 capsular polysaccharide biosynthesis protein [Clostridium saccharoperbutylacetonicum]NSB26261.1 capsular polysaccharide biosynthesis protein [Clostridium saccharoperbutylacetonicum]NSB45613.1 capsular polysaccharide biosynthesis protein [Clostridium saccharoperbutylacetonicum]